MADVETRTLMSKVSDNEVNTQKSTAYRYANSQQFKNIILKSHLQYCNIVKYLMI